MPLYLGLDSSTQSLTAVVIQIDRDQRGVVFETSLNFDEALPHYGTRNGVLPNDDPALAVVPPLIWAEALDVMMTRVAGAGIDIRQIAAISGCGQQHGSVYLDPSSSAALASLDPQQPLADQLRGVFSREASPIWMDSTTAEECHENHGCGWRAAAGAPHRRARLRAIYRTPDPTILQTGEGGLRGHGSNSPCELLSGLAPRRSSRRTRSG